MRRPPISADVDVPAARTASSTSGAPVASVPRSRVRAQLRRIVPPVVATAVLLLLWELTARFQLLPPFLLPEPLAIWEATSSSWENILSHSASTLTTIGLGFLFSVLVGLPLAIAIASSATLAAAIYPLLVLIQSVPKVALAPILVVALGTTEMPRVVITFLVAFFPVVVSSATGLMAAPKELVELARTLRASKLQEMFLIRLPFATPFIFSGLKVAATLCVIGAVVAEFVAADRGLGYLLVSATAFFNTPLAFGAMLVLALIAILVFQLVVWFQARFFAWSLRGERQLE